LDYDNSDRGDVFYCKLTHLTAYQMLRRIIAIAVVVIGLAVFVASVAILSFSLLSSKSGEIAGAVGSVVGGMIGASGAAAAVYLTLSAQRTEDRTRIRNALVREVIEFSRLVVGHLETCENIRSGVIALPVPKLAKAMQMPTPIIYPAVADKVGLLPSPQNVVAFYARIVELSMIVVPALADDPAHQQAILRGQDVRVLVEAWLDILQFAHGILQDTHHDTAFDQAVRESILNDIATQSANARQNFHIPI
jgi:hypothetical protein